MKTLYKMSLSMLLLLLGVCLTSCHDTEASLMNKGRDSRLIGAWLLVETPGREVLSGDKAIVFEGNGACYGFHYKGVKRVFYTENNNRLFVFVYGDDNHQSSLIRSFYYLLSADKLYLWSSEEDMLKRNYNASQTYYKPADLILNS